MTKNAKYVCLFRIFLPVLIFIAPNTLFLFNSAKQVSRTRLQNVQFLFVSPFFLRHTRFGLFCFRLHSVSFDLYQTDFQLCGVNLFIFRSEPLEFADFCSALAEY